ncbi:MAG TPA: 1-(5-phosphoribosyl)-5-[(5-phosphoribosylamino)methylideneamino]imidazole-4-carboxamide isomerase [Anaerohalosphaeraceae bacterium]|nr:1-(5-phosphoribosyl)-5-[(5-phosphoribosylamino)methylideneamino]imidazole-4-carboxamide isomerase [Anaerohalosphaeraceae bacterium]HRT49407.1 1-(5-phosphoribosyl)-5-[(5-phosphoribosylamino)methylideneamino]imidazole-4-carboxamide isomerase [Anaerohalosphaeraceae bacterium]HRT87400.1 1-(5-phosphoribosyl)-5-[(5-phosphoribosylamino)methylideneamino]imidazole-4-carboxamide isomerase [Anaerohalosphaeraceae bacterium]
MDVIPAIDLIGGKCVRLVQGEYHRQITYEDDPIKQAGVFRDAGAQWLHIVDLDGARMGRSVNFEVIKAITSHYDMNVEVGGGIRDEAAIRRMLDAGVKRVIIGTSAVSNFAWFAKMAQTYPGKLAFGLDARGSKVAVAGWTQETPQQLWDFAAQASKLPLSAIIYTDITKDGMMAGPNFDRTKALADAVSLPVIAAGGVTRVEDVVRLRELGAAGAIVGRALYEGTIDLRAAIRAGQG